MFRKLNNLILNLKIIILSKRLFRDFFNNFILTLITLLLIVSCNAKKKSDHFSYGADRDLLIISDYDGKEFDIETGDLVSKTSHKENKIKINSTSLISGHLNFVNYKTDAKFLDDVPFIGKPNTKYKIKYVISNTSFKVYKIAPKKNLSSDEIPSAIKLKSTGRSEELWGVPLVSYYISLFKSENVRNERNEKTHILEPIRVDSKDEAKYFRIDLNSKTLADFLKKEYLLEKDFFDGDWIFAINVEAENSVNKKYFSNSTLFRSGMDSEISKIRLKKSEKDLKFYSIIIDDQVKKDIDKNEVEQNIVLSIPVKWVNYRMSERGRDESVSEIEDDKTIWSSRKYMLPKLEDFKFPELSSWVNMFSFFGMNVSFSNNSSDRELRSFESGIDNGRRFISILIYDGSAKSLLRLFFLEDKKKPDAPDYKPRPVYSSDEKIFGFFTVDKPSLSHSTVTNERDMLPNHLIVRFNPKVNSIVFHPSLGTPDWALDICQEAVEKWNEAFKSAGSKINIVFDPKKVPLGDLRYNVINIIDDLDNGYDYFGIAQWTYDYTTGEIISSAVNGVVAVTRIVTIESIYKYWIHRVGNQKWTKKSEKYFSYLSMEENEHIHESRISKYWDWNTEDSEWIFKLPVLKINEGPTLNTNRNSRKNLSSKRSNFEKLNWKINKKNNLEENFETYDLVSNNDNFKNKNKNKNENESIESTQNKSLKLANSNCEFSKKSSESFYDNSFLADAIKNIEECHEVIEYGDYLSIETNPRKEIEYEKKIISKCSDKLLKLELKSTLVHELGHGFGLRHNFAGSSDQLNMTASDNPEIKQLSTSSIMDYYNKLEFFPLDPKPGPYDIAAIRWGYEEKLIDKDNQSLISDYKPLVPIKAQTEVINKMRTFNFCTDEDAGILDIDPFCDLEDIGVSVYEKLEYNIESFNMWKVKYRYIEAGSTLESHPESSISVAMATNFLMPILSTHTRYRTMINQFKPHLNYLEKETKESFEVLMNEIISHLSANSKIKVNLKDLNSKEKIIAFFKSAKLQILTDNDKKFLDFIDHKLASDRAFEFLKQIIFEPDYACLVKNKDNLNPYLVNFSDLQKELFDKTSYTAVSCSDSHVVDYLKTKHGTFLTEVGYPLNNIYRDLTSRGLEQAPFAVGLKSIRKIALNIVYERYSLDNNDFYSNFFAPNFIDEPDKREEFERLVMDRLLNGISSQFILTPNQMKNFQLKPFYSYTFAQEKNFIISLFRGLANSEIKPIDENINEITRRKFRSEMDYGSADEMPVRVLRYYMNPLDTFSSNVTLDQIFSYPIVDKFLDLNLALDLKHEKDAAGELFIKHIVSALPSISSKENITIGTLISINDDVFGTTSVVDFQSFLSWFIDIRKYLGADLTYLPELAQYEHNFRTSLERLSTGVKEVDSQNVSVLQKKYNTETYNLFKENFHERIDTFMTRRKELNKFYQENQKDLEMHHEIINDILYQFANF